MTDLVNPLAGDDWRPALFRQYLEVVENAGTAFEVAKPVYLETSGVARGVWAVAADGFKPDWPVTLIHLPTGTSLTDCRHGADAMELADRLDCEPFRSVFRPTLDQDLFDRLWPDIERLVDQVTTGPSGGIVDENSC
jgi:hypothetical protein